MISEETTHNHSNGSPLGGGPCQREHRCAGDTRDEVKARAAAVVDAPAGHDATNTILFAIEFVA